MNKVLDNNNLDYDIIVEDALRSVVKKSLEIIKLNGFKENHHFFISFNYKYPGVIVPSELIKLNEEYCWNIINSIWKIYTFFELVLKIYC